MIINKDNDLFETLKEVCDFDIPSSHVKHGKSFVIPYAEEDGIYYRLSEPIEWSDVHGLDWNNVPLNIAWRISQPKVPVLTETECAFIRGLADFFQEYGEDEVTHCFKIGEYNQVDAVTRHFDNAAAMLRHENPFK